jgi:type IV secretory pathway VirB2 component (pilin)
MGQGASAETTTTIISKNAVEAMVSNIMSCRSNSFTSQRFVLSGSYNTVTGYRMVQAMKLSTECAQDAKSVADIQQSVSSALKQAAESQNVSVLGALGSSKAEVNNRIENEVSAKITQQTVLDIVNTTNQEQTAIISGNNNIIDNFSMEQTSEVLANNCQKVLNQLSAVQAIANAAEGNTKATQTNPISDILNSIFSGLTGLGILWVIIIVVAIIVGGVILIKGGPISAILGKEKTGGMIFNTDLGTK